MENSKEVGNEPRGSDRAVSQILEAFDLPDPPDNPKRTYKETRCEFRGGSIAPSRLDREFLKIAQRGARVVTQNPSAPVDDFLELLRIRSPYSNHLRIESPHLAAAVYCGELRHNLGRYPELEHFKDSKRAAVLGSKLESIEMAFRKLASQDQAAREREVAHFNELFAKGRPVPKGKYPFSVEFPDQVAIHKAGLLVLSRGVATALGRKPRGRRPETQTDTIYQAWKAKGSPETTGAILDQLAKTLYPAEFAAARQPKILKRLRDRVRAAVLRGKDSAAKRTRDGGFGYKLKD